MKQLTITTAIGLSFFGTSLLAQDGPGEGVTIMPVKQPYVDEEIMYQILAKGLADLGYTITEPMEVVVQQAIVAVSNGDADFYPSLWHSLHDPFYLEAGGDAKMDRVGTFVDEAVQGYLIDKTTYDSGVTNLGQLQNPAIAAKFDSNSDGKADLAGCVPGWGCERVIEHHLTEFGLRDTVIHNQGQYNAIMADTIAQYRSGQPVIFYTWTPGWVAGELVPGKDVEWISVPYSSLPDGQTGNTEYKGKDLGFVVDAIGVVANKEFVEANPAAKAFFEVARMSVDDLSAQALLMTNGEDSIEDISRHADDWIAANRSIYDGWLETARAAVN